MRDTRGVARRGWCGENERRVGRERRVYREGGKRERERGRDGKEKREGGREGGRVREIVEETGWGRRGGGCGAGQGGGEDERGRL